MSWTASWGGTSYNVMRGTVSGELYATFATGWTSTSYNDTGLVTSAGTTMLSWR